MISTANLHLDPLSVLASLVPLGLLERQCIEVRGEHLSAALFNFHTFTLYSHSYVAADW